MSKSCRACGRPFTAEEVAEKKRRRGAKVSAGLAKAKADGRAVGRPKTRNDAEILRLRASGLSMQKIALKLKISSYTVHKALSDPKQGGEPGNAKTAPTP